MALIPATLMAGFLDMTKNKPATREEAAKKVAETYGNYAMLAQAAGIPMVPTGTEKPKMEQIIALATAIPIGVPPTAAAAFALGFYSYWFLPPAVFPPGVVVDASAGMAALLAALTALFVNPANTDEVFATGMTLAFDAATRLVLVLIPPSPSPVPLV